MIASRFCMQGDDTTSSPSGPGARWAIRGLLLATMLLQIGYFFRHVDDPVLYRDEANDVFTAQASWPDLARHFVTDWDPYVWILALKGWMTLFGTSELAVRGICWASMAIAMLLYFRVCHRRIGDITASAAAAVLLGLGHPMMMTSIGYARPYALTLLSSVWMLDRYLDIRNRPTRARYGWYTLAAIAFGNIQPVNYGLALGIALMAAWDCSPWCGAKRLPWRTGIALLAILALAALPSLLQSARFAGVDTGLSTVAPTEIGARYFVGVAWNWLGSVFPFVATLLPSAFDDNPAEFFRRIGAGEGLWIALMVMVVWLIAAWCFVRRIRSNGLFIQLVPVLALVLAPLLVLGLGSIRVDRLTSPIRSYAAYAPGICLLLVLLVRPWRVLVWTLPALTISRMAAALLFVQDVPLGQRSDAKDAAAWMTDVKSTDLVLIANPALGPSFHYYYRGPSREIVLPYEGPVLYWNDIQLWKDLNRADVGARAKAVAIRAADQGRRIWWIWGGTPLIEDTAFWHPYYAPAAFRAVNEVLAEQFVEVRSETFAKTMEPFHVALYEPRARLSHE